MSLTFPKLKTPNSVVAFLSSALQAFGMYNIHALSGVTEGGVLGATLLFDHWFGLSPAVSSFVLNIACYALGWKTLGKSFIAYSAIAACGYSASFAMSLSHLTKIPIQWIYLTSDLIVLGLSLTYSPVRGIGYSLLTVILSGQLIGLMQRIKGRPEAA